MLVTFCQLIPRNITEDMNPRQYLLEDVISLLHYVFVLGMKADVPHLNVVAGKVTAAECKT